MLAATRFFAVGGDPVFLPFYSLLLLAMLALAPFAEPWFGLLGLTVVIPGYIGGEDATSWLNVVFGFFAVQVAMAGGTPPIPARLRALFDRLGGRKPTDLHVEHVEGEEREPVVLPPERTGLAVDGLRVRFGGLVAVDGLTFEAPTGRITGLIGPNGAGKTTTFDACSGLNRRFEGRITLHGKDITTEPPAVRGRMGMGRTFQRMSLCDTLTVAHNVVLGHECAQAGAGPVTQVAASPAAWRQAQSAAADAMELCGISHLADEQAGSLSTGQRRLVELARCLAGDFDVLLLDEATSGLDPSETVRLGEILRRVTRDRGIGILLVEHDMELVMEICNYIYVLDFGRLIFEGTPQEVRSSEIVRGAYLGDSEILPDAQPAGTGVA
jgi:ABC-type branched-subunit amino acid transport system ATPase component